MAHIPASISPNLPDRDIAGSAQMVQACEVDPSGKPNPPHWARQHGEQGQGADNALAFCFSPHAESLTGVSGIDPAKDRGYEPISVSVDNSQRPHARQARRDQARMGTGWGTDGETIKCLACDDGGWVCENHPDQALVRPTRLCVRRSRCAVPSMQCHRQPAAPSEGVQAWRVTAARQFAGARLTRRLSARSWS